MYWNDSLTYNGSSYSGLIETWDVLKYKTINNGVTTIMINRNMRCIEMSGGIKYRTLCR